MQFAVLRGREEGILAAGADFEVQLLEQIALEFHFRIERDHVPLAQYLLCWALEFHVLISEKCLQCRIRQPCFIAFNRGRFGMEKAQFGKPPQDVFVLEEVSACSRNQLVDFVF